MTSEAGAGAGEAERTLPRSLQGSTLPLLDVRHLPSGPRGEVPIVPSHSAGGGQPVGGWCRRAAQAVSAQGQPRDFSRAPAPSLGPPQCSLCTSLKVSMNSSIHSCRSPPVANLARSAV